MKMSRTPFVATIGAIALGLSLSGCSGSSDAGSGSTSPVAIRLYDDVGSLDPALTSTPPGYQLSMFLYDRVVSVVDGEVQPYLAESWKVTPTSVVFTIRKKATCQDGSKLTPSAIAASMTRAIDPATKAPIAPTYFDKGTTFTGDDAAGTFTVTTASPNPAILLTMTHPVFSVVCPGGLKDPSKLASAGFGSGPYELAKSVAGTSYTLEKRAGYNWGPDSEAKNFASLPKTVTAKVLQNESTAANVFLQGGLDVTSSLNESAVKRMSGKGATEKKTADSFAHLIFNQASSVGADPAVRRAVAQAVDPEAYAAAAQAGLATESANLLPKETPCAQTDGATYRPKFDVDEARKTLEGGGWTRGSDGIFEKDGKPLTLRVRSHNQEGSAGDYLAQVLKDLGVKTDSREVDFPAYVETALGGEWDVFAATVNVLDSPAALNPQLYGSGGLDIGHVRNSAFEKHMADARTAATFDQSCALWKSAQDELVKNVDIVPEAHLNKVYFGKGVDYALGYFGLIEPTSLVRE